VQDLLDAGLGLTDVARLNRYVIVRRVSGAKYSAWTGFRRCGQPFFVINKAVEAQTLLAALYATEADIIPDLKAQALTVHLHQLAKKSRIA
jgi:hypothetical protein